MKILYVTTIGGTMGFFKTLIKQLTENGHTVDIAANIEASGVSDYFTELGCKTFQIDCSRSPFDKGNIKAIKQIKTIARDGGYDIVHCHTPIAAACTRLACRGLRKKGLKVIYTAHGFHFYDGAPRKNWLIFYPVEKFCARFTDVLITINKEDYERAKSKFKARKVEYVPGVGIDIDKFAGTVIDRAVKRREIGVPEDAYLILSVGELNANKNHAVVINALGQVKDGNIHYAIAGAGEKKDELKALAEKLNVNLHLLGYRTDVAELLRASDAYALPSIREGLNVSVMEALASGLPVICSGIRGNVDMVADGENGFYMNPFSVESAADAINKARTSTIAVSPDNASAYDYRKINETMIGIYRKVLE